MDAPDRHDTMVEATALAQTNEYESYHQGVVICSYLIVAVVACIAARDVAVQRAAHTGGVSPDLVGAAAGKDGVNRYERAHSPPCSPIMPIPGALDRSSARVARRRARDALSARPIATHRPAFSGR